MRAIKIDPATKTIEEIDTDGSLAAMEQVLNDGPCMVRIGQGDLLWVGDNGLLSAGNPVFYLAGYPHPLAGPGLVIGCDEMGENVAAQIDMHDITTLVIWTNQETTGNLTPSRDYKRADGAQVHEIGTGILRDRN